MIYYTTKSVQSFFDGKIDTFLKNYISDELDLTEFKKKYLKSEE